MAVKKGDKIKVEYEGKLDTGEVFDSSEKQGKPLEFTAGEGQVIKGFDAAVIGMNKDEEKEVVVKAEDAYGTKKDNLVAKLPRDKLPKDQEPKKGFLIVLTTPDGKQIPARIIDVTDKEITVDLNHPLAGKELHFKITVKEISS